MRTDCRIEASKSPGGDTYNNEREVNAESRCAVAASILIHIRDVTGSHLGTEIGFPKSEFPCYSSVLAGNVWTLGDHKLDYYYLLTDSLQFII
jgi:hypothetical protein